MENLFDLTIYEDVTFPASARTDLFTLCNYLDESEELHNLIDPWYLSEAVKAPQSAMKTIRSFPAKGTKVMDDTLMMYDDLTDGQAYLYNMEWDLIKKLSHLASSISRLVFNLIGWIPKIIISCLDGIASIPDNITKLISGNISLYITIADIETIYGHDVIGKLDEICESGIKLSKGNAWSTFWQRLGKRVGNAVPFHKKEVVPETEHKIAKRMIAQYKSLKGIQFNPSVINLKNPEVKEMYFGKYNNGTDKNISFKGIRIHDKHCTSYLEALQILSKSISERQKHIDEVARLMDVKSLNADAKQSWEGLPASYKIVITDAYKAMSGVIDFAAKVMKYISIDMRTYQRALDKINKARTRIKQNNVVTAIDITEPKTQ